MTNEIKNLVFTISVVVIFVAYVSYVPSSLIAVGTYNDPTEEIPTYYQGSYLGVFSTSHAYGLNDSVFNDGFQFGGKSYNYDLGGKYWLGVCHYNAVNNYTEFYLGERWYFGFLRVGVDFLRFKSEAGIDRGTSLSDAELQSDYETGEEWVKYTVTSDLNEEIRFDLFFGFDGDVYDNIKDAFNDQGVIAIHGSGIDETLTNLNAWQLIGALMLFQMPDIHPLFTLIIVFPIYAMFALSIAYVVRHFFP